MTGCNEVESDQGRTMYAVVEVIAVGVVRGDVSDDVGGSLRKAVFR